MQRRYQRRTCIDGVRVAHNARAHEQLEFIRTHRAMGATPQQVAGYLRERKRREQLRASGFTLDSHGWPCVRPVVNWL